MASEIKCGSYTGAGANATIELGWVPEWVEVINMNTAAMLVWHSAMESEGTPKYGLDVQVTPAFETTAATGVSAYTGSDTAGSEESAGFIIGATLSSNTHTICWRAGRSGD